MKKLLVLLSLPLMLVATSVPVQAQMDGPVWVFGLNGGYALPTGDFGDVYDGALVAGANICYMFTEQYGLGLSAEWNKHPRKDSDDLTFQFIPVTVDFMAAFPTGGTVLPYVKGGLGIYFEEVELEVGGVPESHSASDFGFNVGGGMQFPVAETTVIDVGARFHNVLTEDESTQYFTVTAGVGFTF